MLRATEPQAFDEDAIRAALKRAAEDVAPLVESIRRAGRVTQADLRMRFCPPGRCPHHARPLRERIGP